MGRVARRHARACLRWRRTGFVSAVVLVALGLSAVGLTFAPLVEPEEPRVITLPGLRSVSQPLDAAGMADIALGVGYGYVKAVNDWRWYRHALMYDHWLRIGHCEQPGNGVGGVDWGGGGTNPTGTYLGGLGIRSDAWAQNSYGIPPDILWQPEGQMIVATRVYQYAGPGGWGCK